MTQNNAQETVQPGTSLIVRGDVTGSTSAATVTKLENIAVKSGTPTDQYVLEYVSANSDWEPAAALSMSNTYLTFPITTVGVNTTYNVVSTDILIVASTNGINNTNIYLMSGTYAGRIVMVINTYGEFTGAGTGIIYVYPPSGYLLNGSSSLIEVFNGQFFDGGGSMFVCSDGNNWTIMNGGIAS